MLADSATWTVQRIIFHAICRQIEYEIEILRRRLLWAFLSFSYALARSVSLFLPHTPTRTPSTPHAHIYNNNTATIPNAQTTHTHTNTKNAPTLPCEPSYLSIQHPVITAFMEQSRRRQCFVHDRRRRRRPPGRSGPVILEILRCRRFAAITTGYHAAD